MVWAVEMHELTFVSIHAFMFPRSFWSISIFSPPSTAFPAPSVLEVAHMQPEQILYCVSGFVTCSKVL